MSDRLQPPSKRGGVGDALEGRREVGASEGVFSASPQWDLHGGTGGSTHRLVSPCDLFGAGRPAIHAWMTALELDGKPRETASLTLFVEEGQVKAAFSDREGGYVLFRSGDTIEALLDSLERALCTNKADWRASKRK